MGIHKSWSWSFKDIPSTPTVGAEKPGSKKKGLLKKLASLPKFMTCGTCSTIEDIGKEEIAPAFTIRAWAGTEPIPPTEASFDAWAAPSRAAVADGWAVRGGEDVAARELGAAGEGVLAALCPEEESAVLDGHAGDKACSIKDAQAEDLETVAAAELPPIVLSRKRVFIIINSPWVRARKFDDRVVDRLVARLKQQVKRTSLTKQAAGSGEGMLPPVKGPSASSSPGGSSPPAAESPPPSAAPAERSTAVLRLLRPGLNLLRRIWVLGPWFLGPAEPGPPSRGLRAVPSLLHLLLYLLAAWVTAFSYDTRVAVYSLPGDMPLEVISLGAAVGVLLILSYCLLALPAVVEAIIDVVLLPVRLVVGVARVCRRLGEAVYR